MRNKDIKLIQAAIDAQLTSKQKNIFEERLKTDSEFKHEYNKWVLAKKILRYTTQAKAPRNFTITHQQALELNPFKIFFFARLSKAISYVAMVLLVGVFIFNSPVSNSLDSLGPMARTMEGIQEESMISDDVDQTVQLVPQQKNDPTISSSEENSPNLFGTGTTEMPSNEVENAGTQISNQDDTNQIQAKQPDSYIQNQELIQPEPEKPFDLFSFYQTHQTAILAASLLIIASLFWRISQRLKY